MSLIEDTDRLSVSPTKITISVLSEFTKSDDIAAFLDYSVHTINTYKTRVKNKSSVDNARFEESILAIESVEK